MVSDNPETFADLDGHCEPFCGLVAWVIQGVASEGGANFAANVGVGIAKGAGTFAVATGQSLVAGGQIGGGNPIAAVSTLMTPGPAALSPSNETQAKVSVATQLTLTGAALVADATAIGASAGLPETVSSTDFVVTPEGETIAVPDGASGPSSTRASGVEYQGGSGGKGMNDRVTGVRIMDANENQGPRVSYNNASGQKVDPVTGKTVSNSHPKAHMPLKPKGT